MAQHHAVERKPITIEEINNSKKKLDGRHNQDGTPDMRLKENRKEDVIPNTHSSNERANVKEESVVVAGTHRTLSGAPDRRYMENSFLTEDEAKIDEAKHVLETHGLPIPKGNQKKS